MTIRYARRLLTRNKYVRSLFHFWPVLLIGLVVAAVAGTDMVATIKPAVPPKVKLRNPPTYAATQVLLVNSAQNPLVRTAITSVVPKPSKISVLHNRGKGHSGTSSLTAVPQSPSISVHAPDISVLVRAANLYPRLIMSDQVTAVRTKMFGPSQGHIQAAALNSFQTPTKYRASSFPMIEITATAKHPKAAIKLAEHTSAAFEAWLTTSQAQAGVPAAERILVQDLVRPTKAVSTGGSKLGLPLFVGFFVLVLFAGIAIGLDRLRMSAAAAQAATAAVNGDVQIPLADGVAERRAALDAGVGLVEASRVES
jgi:hypothetical protein